MACEFLGSEYKKGVIGTVRAFCTINDLGCLVDEPMGHLTCTRRTFALMQGCEPGETPMDTKRKPIRKQVDKRQMALG